jgi:hypothetical protein
LFVCLPSNLAKYSFGGPEAAVTPEVQELPSLDHDRLDSASLESLLLVQEQTSLLNPTSVPKTWNLDLSSSDEPWMSLASDMNHPDFSCVLDPDDNGWDLPGEVAIDL